MKGWRPRRAGTKFRDHLDGFNQLPYLTGQEPHGPRHEFYYFDDDGDLVAVRFDNWKLVFGEQRQRGQFDIWANPFTFLRVPKMYNLRMDPYEHADISGSGYDQWRVKNAYLTAEAVIKSAAFLETFVGYPPSQKPASFSVDQVRKHVDQQIEENARKRGTK